ncbi:hypothetical protein ACI3L3_11900 [Desulfobaculum sp. SPO524]|uniref:hypothetical protein n=1 Tax=Desulfobaculum sp. SPO524 TaxID=3378071 RepID=UPI003854EB1C
MKAGTLALIESGLRLGVQAYETAMRLKAEGYDVPALDDFQRRTDELRDLPDLAPKGAHGLRVVPPSDGDGAA